MSCKLFSLGIRCDTARVLAATGKGRSVVVTRDMKAGQLLFVVNPLAIAHVDSNQAGLHIDMHSRRMVRVCQHD